MRAACHTHYGPPEVVSVREVPKPAPKPGEVLVRVHASTINRTDCGFRLGKPYGVRLFSGLTKPKDTIWGNEFSGIVEEVGAGVQEFKLGDEVFGIDQKKWGAHAEYKCMKASEPITLKPVNLSMRECVALLEGPWLAMNYLEKIKLNHHHSILINGASGSISSSGIQLAKHFGAMVTAVTDTKHLQLAKTLGADEVVDYTREDFTAIGKTFDFVFDAVGKSSFGACKKLLKPGGLYFSTDLGPNWNNTYLPLLTMFSDKKVIFPLPKESKQTILFIKKLIENGALKPVIDRVYPLEQIVEAYRYVDKGMKTGNVIIRIS
jgi:NADPH:quinone reductase-like Zn-dependent oxidoreductase